jgi:hypothetical protein
VQALSAPILRTPESPSIQVQVVVEES